MIWQQVGNGRLGAWADIAAGGAEGPQWVERRPRNPVSSVRFLPLGPRLLALPRVESQSEISIVEAALSNSAKSCPHPKQPRCSARSEYACRANSPAAKSSFANARYRLLWSTRIIACVPWGINGANTNTAVDMMVALYT